MNAEERKLVEKKYKQLFQAEDKEELDTLRDEIDHLLSQKDDDKTSKKQYPTILKNVMTPVWTNQIPRLWTNNNVESQNHVFKIQTEWRLHRIPDLIEELYSLHASQYTQVRKALSHQGDFRLANNYQKHQGHICGGNAPLPGLANHEGKTQDGASPGLPSSKC